MNQGPVRNRDCDHVMLNLSRESQGCINSFIKVEYKAWTFGPLDEEYDCFSVQKMRNEHK
jgi:hypothetical protein